MPMFDDRGKIFLNAMDMVKCFSTLAAGSLDVFVIFRDAKATVGTLFSHCVRVGNTGRREGCNTCRSEAMTYSSG
jgi:hypothetical protein